MNELSKKEQERRIALAAHARSLVSSALPIENATESGVLLRYEDYYLQIVFSELHPLMVITFIRGLDNLPEKVWAQRRNELNVKTVLGCHYVDKDVGFYSFRAAHWLDTELTKSRFLEMLHRCYDEVCVAYRQINRSR